MGLLTDGIGQYCTIIIREYCAIISRENCAIGIREYCAIRIKECCDIISFSGFLNKFCVVFSTIIENMPNVIQNLLKKHWIK